MNIVALSNHNYDNTTLFSIPNVKFITSKDELTFDILEKYKPDYVFFPHWSYIIPKQIYENFHCVIFHMTDLPFGRGGSPLQNLIERGIYNTKISAIKCVKEVDAGDIYLKKDFCIKNGSASELFTQAGNIITQMIEEIISNQLIPKPQTGKIVSFNRRTKENSNISNLSEIIKIFDYIRMLDADGYPKAFIDTKTQHLEFSNARINGNSVEAKVVFTLKKEESI